MNGVTLTRLDVAIAADATVGEVNAALESVRGLIVGMVDGLPMVVVGVPRQDSPEALAALAATLQAQPGILLVLPGRDVAPDRGAAAARRRGRGLRIPARDPVPGGVERPGPGRFLRGRQQDNRDRRRQIPPAGRRVVHRVPQPGAGGG